VLIEWYLPLVIYGHFSPGYRSHLKKVNCINILANNGSRKCLIFITTKTEVMILGSLADVGERSTSSLWRVYASATVELNKLDVNQCLELVVLA